MEPVTTAALIGAGASALGGGANAIATASMNKKTREWNEKMYAKQHADNIASWNMQNSYNSPQEQMARLQAAGLNPQLVYGQGAVANSTSAPDVPSSMPWRAETPDLGIPKIADTYFNVKSQQQLLSNQKQQGNLLAIEQLGKLQDVKSKSMLNDYMSTHGYGLKLNTADAALQALLLKNIGSEALNNYNFGGNSSSFTDDSAYSLQAKGLKLLNDLRGGEKKLKGVQLEMDSTRNKYLKRTMSGELGDMSAKDWIQSILGGASLLKK
ncbi:MAG: DNA pilot protein [Malazfec virus 7]